MTNSPTNVQQAATIASAIASALAAQVPGTAMNAGTAAGILGSLVQVAGPALNPQFTAAIGLATVALSAIHVATQSNTGVTAEQLKTLFAADDAAIAADLAAQHAAA